MERIYGVREGSLNEKGNNRIGEPNNSGDQITQSDIAAQMGISVDTLQNYKMMAEMIPELEDLMDTGIVTKTTALAKQRKVAVEYVRLCGYENGEIGNGRKKDSHNGKATKMTLNEIASQLGTSERNLQRALSIERNLTDSMKGLLEDIATSHLSNVSPLLKENVITMRRKQGRINQKQAVTKGLIGTKKRF